MLSSHTYKSLCEQTPGGSGRKGFWLFRTRGAVALKSSTRGTAALKSSTRGAAAKALCVALLVIGLALAAPSAKAQCSVCSRTAQQLGEKPAKSLNKAIIYLMVAPFGIMGFIGFRWWKNEYGKQSQ
jgi:hypothetical protein